MKKIINYLGGLILAVLLAQACTPEDFPSLSEAGIPLASNFEDMVEILVDQSTNQVTFNLNSKGNMPLWIIDGKNYSTVNGMKRIYTVAGDYRVEVKIANANGVSDGTIVKTFHLDNTLVNLDKYIALMAGSESKEWRIAKDEVGHLACGESGSDGMGWYKAGVNEKASMGLYDDIVTFDVDKNYSYNPGEGGTVFVNAGTTAFSQYNPNDGNDFMVPVDEQKTTFDFEVVGSDLYLVFPPKTLFPYIANDQAYNEPRYKVVSLDSKRMELLVDNGEIAWHYTLASGMQSTFNGFKYDSDCNMWKNATVESPVFWYAPGWSQIDDPEYTLNGSTYQVVLPQATAETWQAQMKLPTNISTSAASHYDFSVILNATKDHGNITVKLTDGADDNNFYFTKAVQLKAFEDQVFYLSDMEGLDIDALTLVFDFGGNSADTEITIKNIVVKEHACDDGTVLPEVLPEEEVDWREDAPDNLWKSATFSNSFYYAPGWSQIADPELTISNGTYSLVFPQATSDQWQNQVFFKTDISTNTAVHYDFKCVLNSSKSIGGVTVKLTMDGDDNTFFFTERVDLKPFEDFVLKKVSLAGLDIPKVNLVFDFGGNPEDTEISISAIVLQEHISN